MSGLPRGKLLSPLEWKRLASRKQTKPTVRASNDHRVLRKVELFFDAAKEVECLFKVWRSERLADRISNSDIEALENLVKTIKSYKDFFVGEDIPNRKSNGGDVD